tara:strand:- start:261 stop:596 length:336 start_codon:yes stop_codon:yes gene_type:complete
MDRKIENVTIKVDGFLDEEPTIDLNQIELDLFKNKTVNTDDWEGLPKDYRIDFLTVSYNEIDHNDYENPVDDIQYKGYEKVLDDLFEYVPSKDRVKGEYFYQLRKEVESDE